MDDRGDNSHPEVHAFPAALARAAGRTLAVLTPDALYPTRNHACSVALDGERLAIPVRVYYDQQRLLANLDAPGDHGLIALCLGARHYNGYMRERCLRRLLDTSEHWIAPFVLHLLGEYVVEIIRPIHARLSQGVDARFLDLARENPAYLGTLERRAISYWSCYYRGVYPAKEDYPGLQALKMICK